MHLPNIETALEIKVSESGNGFRADTKALPGSPICGQCLMVNFILLKLAFVWKRKNREKN